MRIVKTRSIRNVDDDRLIDSLGQIHEMIHTPEGIIAYDNTRRSMINQGIKGRAITAELQRRGHQPGTCRFCWKQ